MIFGIVAMPCIFESTFFEELVSKLSDMGLDLSFFM